MTRMRDVVISTQNYEQVYGEAPRGLAVWGFRRADMPTEVGKEVDFEMYGTYHEASTEARRHFAKLGELDIELVSD